jgi:hypothetical protein
MTDAMTAQIKAMLDQIAQLTSQEAKVDLINLNFFE